MIIDEGCPYQILHPLGQRFPPGPDHFPLAFTYECLAAHDEWQNCLSGVPV